ncbi:hypothetical protein M2475_001648 [Breznakia sp. PF5-3]|nr:hypothetical protein [Breznakia sp. PF5-3]MDF9838291.1 hypothetical protein [Breznakia sp. PFB2-8]MDF9860313.1 hypothetical protein [Breznakia sp. PH5-24]
MVRKIYDLTLGGLTSDRNIVVTTNSEKSASVVVVKKLR